MEHPPRHPRARGKRAVRPHSQYDVPLPNPCPVFRFILGRRWQRAVLMHYTASILAALATFYYSNDDEVLRFAYVVFVIPGMGFTLVLLWDLWVMWCMALDEPFEHPGGQDE